MSLFKKIVFTTSTLVIFAIVGAYCYFVVSTFHKFEFLLLCSQGKESLIPKYVCQTYLFKYGGSPSDIANINRDIGVVWAVSAENRDDKVKLLNFLLAKGADINAINERTGLSALHAMVLDNNTEAVAILLKRGADPNLKDKRDGQTPLVFALARQGRPDQPDRTPIINLLNKTAKH